MRSNPNHERPFRDEAPDDPRVADFAPLQGGPPIDLQLNPLALHPRLFPRFAGPRLDCTTPGASQDLLTANALPPKWPALPGARSANAVRAPLPATAPALRLSCAHAPRQDASRARPRTRSRAHPPRMARAWCSTLLARACLSRRDAGKSAFSRRRARAHGGGASWRGLTCTYWYLAHCLGLYLGPSLESDVRRKGYSEVWPESAQSGLDLGKSLGPAAPRTTKSSSVASKNDGCTSDPPSSSSSRPNPARCLGDHPWGLRARVSPCVRPSNPLWTDYRMCHRMYAYHQYYDHGHGRQPR